MIFNPIKIEKNGVDDKIKREEYCKFKTIFQVSSRDKSNYGIKAHTGTGNHFDNCTFSRLHIWRILSLERLCCLASSALEIPFRYFL